ncbi:MAG: ribonuclease III, partial [Microthrixaceae bacterium]
MPSTTSSHGSDTHPSEAAPLPGNLGYDFDDPELLELALRHRSWCAEHGGVPSNERLEFLGDSVLGVVITEHLFRAFPGQPEGVLARRRAELVNTVMLAEISAEMNMGAEIQLGKGEERTGGREKASILADALEAVLGAVFLDGGLEASRRVIADLYGDRLVDVAEGAFMTDHKSRLQELSAQRFGDLPRYELSGSGPEHAKVFTAAVTVDGKEIGSGEGRTKKEAEQAAAAKAYEHLIDEFPTDLSPEAQGSIGTA